MMDPSIGAHYELGAEKQRLFANGEPRLEFVRTLELLARFLPAPPARLIDVGGGPGAYAAVWARAGYDVQLYDAFELHVEQARKMSTEGAALFGASLADARSVPEPDASAEVVVMLGPLYHLTKRADRLAALREAHRMLKPGAMLAAAVISRFAALFDGLQQGWLSDPMFLSIVESGLTDGQHRNPDPAKNPHWFTTAYFHRPEEVAPEFEEAGFEHVTVLGIEGPGELLPKLWDDLQGRSDVLLAARKIESEPSLLGLSAHLLAIGRKPG